MKYSKGIMWLDDCRIPFVDESEDTTRGKYENKVQVGIMAERPNIKFVGSFDDSAKQGRFTPNLLVCDDALNDGNIVQYNKTRVDNGTYLGGHREEFVGTDNNPIKNKIKGQFFSDKGSNSRYYDLDLWFEKMLDGL